MKKTILLLLAFAMLLSMALPAAAALTLAEQMSAAVYEESRGGELGAAAVIIESGKQDLLFFGQAADEDNTPVDVQMPFELGELSGIFVAVTAQKMAEAGLLSLDEDIAVYLPAAFMKNLALAYPVTTRHLLLGQAGFAGRRQDLYFTDPAHAFDDLPTALLADIPEQALLPGTCHISSPFGMALAAYVLEVVADTPYSALAKTYVFDPLDMRQTGFADVTHPCDLPGGQGSIPGLYPACGAYTTAEDLGSFLSWMLAPVGAPVLSDAGKQALIAISSKGPLSASSLGLSAVGTLVGGVGRTIYQSAALWIDPAGGRAVAILTNTADNTLTALPGELMLHRSAPTLPEGEPYDLKLFGGIYADASLEKRSFLGRFEIANDERRITVNKDGTLQWGDLRLSQIAPGIFAPAEQPGAGPVLQFFFHENGEVAAFSTVEGAVYLPMPFYLSYSVATLTLAVLLLLAVWFLISGIFSAVSRLHRKEANKKARSIYYAFPHLFSGLQSVTVLIAVGLGVTLGRAVFGPVYGALSVICLLTGLVATVAYIIAFIRSFFRRRLHHRIAYSAMLFLLFQIVIRLWGLAPF